MRRRETYATFAFCASLLLHGAVFFALVQVVTRELTSQLNYGPLPGHQQSRSYTAGPQESQLPSDEGLFPAAPKLIRPPQLFGMPDGKGESVNPSPGDVPAISRPGDQDQAALSRDPIGSGILTDDMLSAMFPGGGRGGRPGPSGNNAPTPAPEQPQAAAPAPFGVGPAPEPPAPRPKVRPPVVAAAQPPVIGLPPAIAQAGPADSPPQDKPDQLAAATQPATTQPDPSAKPDPAIAMADPQPADDPAHALPSTRPVQPPVTRPVIAAAVPAPDPSAPHQAMPARMTHVPPSPAGGGGGTPGPGDGPISSGIVAPPAVLSDSDSDAFSAKAANVTMTRLGKVDARFGRQIKTVRPKLTLKAWNDLGLMSDRALVLKLTMDATGKVTDVSIVRSSGSNDVDTPVYLAAWEFWVEPPKDHAGRPLPDAIFMTISWR